MSNKERAQIFYTFPLTSCPQEHISNVLPQIKLGSQFYAGHMTLYTILRFVTVSHLHEQNRCDSVTRKLMLTELSN